MPYGKKSRSLKTYWKPENNDRIEDRKSWVGERGTCLSGTASTFSLGLTG